MLSSFYIYYIIPLYKSQLSNNSLPHYYIPCCCFCFDTYAHAYKVVNEGAVARYSHSFRGLSARIPLAYIYIIALSCLKVNTQIIVGVTIAAAAWKNSIYAYIYTHLHKYECLPICVCVWCLSIYIISYNAYIYKRQKIVYLTITAKRKKGSNCFPLVRVYFNFCIVFRPLQYHTAPIVAVTRID